MKMQIQELREELEDEREQHRQTNRQLADALAQVLVLEGRNDRQEEARRQPETINISGDSTLNRSFGRSAGRPSATPPRAGGATSTRSGPSRARGRGRPKKIKSGPPARGGDSGTDKPDQLRAGRGPG